MPKKKRLKLYPRTKKWLRHNYPLPWPCRIRLTEENTIKGCLGQFLHDGERGLIRICKQSPMPTQAETLIEEYAHALRHALPLGVDYEGEPHDAIFWAIYGELINNWRSHC